MTLQEACGNPPSAADYATRTIGPLGEVLLSPLTAEQNAAYLAAVARYQQCIAPFQQTPPCPPGEYFTGNLTDGVWYGHCVSVYTGQATTPDTLIPLDQVATMPPLTTTPAQPAPPIGTAGTPAAPPIAKTPAPSTSSAGSTPATSATPKLKPHDLFIEPGGGLGDYCSQYPFDPYCSFYTNLGSLVGLGVTQQTVIDETVIEQVGLVASDVHNIVDQALNALWKVVIAGIDAALIATVSSIQDAVTALGNALKSAWNTLSRLAGLMLHFLGHLWYYVLHGLLLAVQEIASWLKILYKDILKPMLGLLQQLRQKILDLWKRFVVPLLIVIQDIRKVLNILAAFHIKWAAKLDAKLADLERKITQPLIVLLGYINQLANWMNLIVTAGYLLQRPLWLNSLKVYAGSSIGLQIAAMNQPLSGATLQAAQATMNAPTAQQSKTELAQFLGDGTGSFAAPIADAGATFDTFLRQVG